MEQIGGRFFIQLIDWIWAVRVPLGMLLSVYLVKELRRLPPPERRHVVLMSGYFFLIIATYWLIKPIKKALLLGHYQATGWVVWGQHLEAAQVELVAKELNIVLALLATVAFVRLAARLKRERLALCLTAFFALGFTAFAVSSDPADQFTAWLFYLYGDLFITLMLAGFFAFLNDSGDVARARRLYGMIGLGGVLGGFFGSTVVAGHAGTLNFSLAALICVGFLGLLAVVISFCGTLVARMSPITPPSAASARDAPAGHAAQPVIRSPYLLGLASIVGVYEMVSPLMDYQFTATVLHFVSGEHLKVYFAGVYAFTNLCALLLQIFLTPFVLTRVGVHAALLFLPMAAILGEAAFLLWPGLLVGSLLNTLDNAFSYSIHQSSKEALYVPVGRETKYQAKGVIDIFIVRAAKGIAVAVSLLLTFLFAGFDGVRWLSLVVLGMLWVWLQVIRDTGRVYKNMEQEKEGCNAAVA